MNDSLHISSYGLSLQKDYEKGPPAISPQGFATKMYLDDAGKPTIGWGHVITASEGHLRTATIDSATAERILAQDNISAENSVKQLVKIALFQNEFDALVCLRFNIGAGNFAASTLLKKLNAGKNREAADEFLRWNKYTDPKCGCLRVANGLSARREDERALFMVVKHA